MKDEGKKKTTGAMETITAETWGIDSEISALLGISGLFNLGLEAPEGKISGLTLGYLSELLEGILKKMQGHVDAIFEVVGADSSDRFEKEKTAPAAPAAKG